MINIALADDHKLLRKSLADWLATQGFNILFEANNGKELIEKLNKKQLPTVVLMDINMPIMDGFETTEWLTKNYPTIKVLAISMYNTELNIIKMLKLGAKGYLLKDSEPAELKLAIETIINKGFYYTELVNNKLIAAINETEFKQKKVNNLLELTPKEIDFLKLICTDDTYKEIAYKMSVSHRTVDGYRDVLLQKLNLNSRIGLVMYAIKMGIVNP